MNEYPFEKAFRETSEYRTGFDEGHAQGYKNGQQDTRQADIEAMCGWCGGGDIPIITGEGWQHVWAYDRQPCGAGPIWDLRLKRELGLDGEG